MNNYMHNDKKNKRGEILYYSLEQVATLLNETETSIKYYTNLFSHHLKLEIINQRIMYHKKDILKLEFLIELHAKGLPSKQIDDFYKNTTLELTNDNFDDFNKTDIYSSIIKDLEVTQNKIVNTIKENINSNNLSVNENIEKQLSLLNELSSNISNSLETITNKIESIQSHDINNSINVQLNNNNSCLNEQILNLLSSFEQNRVQREEVLLKEIKRSNNIINSAYEMQVALDESESNKGFFSKLFARKASY